MTEDALTGLGELAVAPGLAGEVDDHDPGFIFFTASRSPGSALAGRERGRGDDDVDLADRLRHQLLLPRLLLGRDSLA